MELFCKKNKTIIKECSRINILKTTWGTKIWCIQHKTLTIDASKLIKYRRWLLVMVCLLTLIPIKKIITTHHNTIIFDQNKFIRPNINVLIEKWMPCDLLWVLICLNSKYVLKLRGNEEYCYKK
jgi:hypothetical protein